MLSGSERKHESVQPLHCDVNERMEALHDLGVLISSFGQAYFSIQSLQAWFHCHFSKTTFDLSQRVGAKATGFFQFPFHVEYCSFLNLRRFSETI